MMDEVPTLALSRRQFGAMFGATLMAGAVTGCAAEGLSSAGEGALLSKVGIQLYSIRDTFQADPLAALAAVAAAGFAEVEFGGGGYFERDPAELKGLLDRTGLVAPSMHAGQNELEQSLDRVILIARTVGANHVVLPASLPGTRKSVEGYRQVAQLCTRVANRLATEGISFYYHNHDWEFTQLDGGTTGFDILTGETDPALVKLELDLYWANKAGQDIFRLFEKHAGRIELCHVKDTRPSGEMTLPGEGLTDFQAIFAQASKAGLRHFFVEDDRLVRADPARLRATVKYLQGLRLS